MLIPLIFYGSEHHWLLILPHITAYDSIGYKHFCNFGDMLIGSVFCRDAYELSRLQRRATLTFRQTDKTWRWRLSRARWERRKSPKYLASRAVPTTACNTWRSRKMKRQPAAAKARSAQMLRNSPRTMPLSSSWSQDTLNPLSTRKNKLFPKLTYCLLHTTSDLRQILSFPSNKTSLERTPKAAFSNNAFSFSEHG